MCPAQESLNRLLEAGVIGTGCFRSGNKDDIPSWPDWRYPQDFAEKTFHPVPDYGTADPLAYGDTIPGQC